MGSTADLRAGPGTIKVLLSGGGAQVNPQPYTLNPTP